MHRTVEQVEMGNNPSSSERLRHEHVRIRIVLRKVEKTKIEEKYFSIGEVVTQENMQAVACASGTGRHQGTRDRFQPSTQSRDPHEPESDLGRVGSPKNREKSDD